MGLGGFLKFLFGGYDANDSGEEDNAWAKSGAKCSNCYYFDQSKWEHNHISDDGREVGPQKYDWKFWCGSTGQVMKCKSKSDEVYEKCLCSKPSVYHHYK